MTKEPVNTVKNSPRKGQFVKGDPRINRKGRPHSFNALRVLAIQIATEKAAGRDTSNIEQILLEMATNRRNVQDRQKFIEIAYGKVPEEINLKTPEGLRVIIEYADGKNTDPEAAPGATPGQADPEEV
jgi:hypothetical protein